MCKGNQGCSRAVARKESSYSAAAPRSQSQTKRFCQQNTPSSSSCERASIWRIGCFSSIKALLSLCLHLRRARVRDQHQKGYHQECTLSHRYQGRLRLALSEREVVVCHAGESALEWYITSSIQTERYWAKDKAIFILRNPELIAIAMRITYFSIWEA